MRNFIRLTLFIAASTALFACKPKQEAPPPVAATGSDEAAAAEAKVAAHARDVEACKLTMSAPESADWATYWTPSDSSNQVQSVHWASAKEQDAQAQNFLANPLTISCSSGGTPSVAVTLTASGATAADIPMSSGSYPISGTQQPPVKGAQMLASTLTFNGRSFDARKGTLTVSRFDSNGVEGSFVVDGIENNDEAAPIHLEGTFEIPCVGGLMQSECTANGSK
jgi:CelD/BcsL family acetyltransferase involved in cellulose biosynthesis